MGDTEQRREEDKASVGYYLIVETKGTTDDPPLEDPPEVIELALVAVDAQSGQVIGDFQRFVRPEANPELSPHCVSLTGISQAQIDESELLEEVLDEANRWVAQLIAAPEDGGESTLLRAVTYGQYAMKEILLDQIDDEELEVPSWTADWLNLQLIFKRHFAMRSLRSLYEALKYLGLSPKGRPNSAIDDAHNIAQILSELIHLDARMVLVSDQNYHSNQGSSIEEKPGDWRCDSCQFLNFARRHFCKDCGQQRTDGVQPPPQASQFNQQEAKPGDWHCDRCSFMNFARRNSCKNCSAPRPGAAPSHDRGPRSFGGGGGGRGPRMKPGDWRCGDCSFVNFARREFCKDCGGARPADVQRAPQQQGRPGDWSCSGCSYFNFAYRDVCGQCGESKPAEG